MKSEIQFINEKLLESFGKLESGITKDEALAKFIKRAFGDIKDNPFCGVQIPKKQIPKVYIQKYGIKNLWKYNLPDAWRLIYSIENGRACIISIIVEWLDHKSYERRFCY